MGRAFDYVILGGGVSAGYAALEFVKHGINHGELCIISQESVAPYERPALSKGFLLPEGAAHLPAFHTCVGTNEERLTPKWYKEHGIELVLGTQVKSADVKHKTLLTASGETITYKILIIATGAQVLRLEEFGVTGSDAKNICYLRDLNDATKLVNVMASCTGAKAVVIGGGYIGMECAAALITNNIHVTMVFPEKHLMARLFSLEIAAFYEDYYRNKGVQFVKGTVMSSFERDSEGKVVAVILKNGTRLDADMVVVGIGIKANTGLFEDQLVLEKSGIKVNGKMQTSNSYAYAVGDVAAFPLKFSGEIRRLEHVDFARKSAKHAVKAIMAPDKIHDLDYLPYFYSRVFTLSWQFYGDNIGDVIHFGDSKQGKFGAYWVDRGQLVGAFLEGGGKDEYAALENAARLRPFIRDKNTLSSQGVEFALSFKQSPAQDFVGVVTSKGNLLVEYIPPYTLQVTAGVFVAVTVAAFAFWYGRKRRRW
uniref:monodehydroascorbate reductase (NADH) n=1 Tax=Wollemia nobilis TaxID=56998 RepID=A0A0C9QM80_9CONI